MTARGSRRAIAALVVACAWPLSAAAQGQPSTAPRDPLAPGLELSIGAGFLSGGDLDDADADLRNSTGGDFRLFATSSRIGSRVRAGSYSAHSCWSRRRRMAIAPATPATAPAASRPVIIPPRERPFFFGLVSWETARALLLQTNGPRKSALVRCVRADCERASRVRSAPASRASGTAFRLPGRPAARP